MVLHLPAAQRDICSPSGIKLQVRPHLLPLTLYSHRGSGCTFIWLDTTLTSIACACASHRTYIVLLVRLLINCLQHVCLSACAGIIARMSQRIHKCSSELARRLHMVGFMLF